MKDGTYYIRGKAFYAKVLGKPVPNYNKDGHEWTIEIKPDDAGKKTLKELKIDDRITKGEDRDRILFRQRLHRANGEENRPITVVDAKGQPWPENKLIGNESVVDMKFNYKDWGKGKKAGVYPVAVRILEHVPYERQEFAPLNEEDQFFRARDEDEAEAPDFKRDFGIDDDEDDIPID